MSEFMILTAASCYRSGIHISTLRKQITPRSVFVLARQLASLEEAGLIRLNRNYRQPCIELTDEGWRLCFAYMLVAPSTEGFTA